MCISNFNSSATGSCQARCASRAGILRVWDGGETGHASIYSFPRFPYIGQALNPNTQPEHYDINRHRGEIDWNWTLIFRLTIYRQPALFPHHVVREFHDIYQDDFDIAIHLDDDDFDPPEPLQRWEQKWERLAREVPAGRGKNWTTSPVSGRKRCRPAA